MAEFPMIQSPGNPLLSMLAQLAAQGQRQQFLGYQQLGQGISEAGQGVARGIYAKGAAKQDADRLKAQQDFAQQQERMRLATEGARERRRRGMDVMQFREGKRQFDVGQKSDEENRLLTRLGVAEGQLRQYQADGITPPPEFLAGLNALRQRALGFGGPTGATQPPPPPPPKEEPPPPPPPGASVFEVAKQKRLAQQFEHKKAEETRKEMGNISIANTKDIAPFVRQFAPRDPSVAASLAGVGLGVREAAEGRDFTRRKIEERAAHIGRVMTESGASILSPDRSMEEPKSVPGKLLRGVATLVGSGKSPEEALAAVKKQAGALWRFSARGRAGDPPASFTSLPDEDLLAFGYWVQSQMPK